MCVMRECVVKPRTVENRDRKREEGVFEVVEPTAGGFIYAELGSEICVASTWQRRWNY